MTREANDSVPSLADDALLAPFREREDPVLTTDELLASLPFGGPAVRETLERLNTEGVLERKSVGDGEVWWLPGHTSTDERAEPMAGMAQQTTSIPRELETAIQALDGIDERQRAAIYATCHFLYGEESADAATIQSRVYPDQPADYDDPERWWTECVRPALADLPGVEQVDGGWRLG